jgi:predicted subunit of tRNA(5-methylaminomethyl-2-thiouridylate) methyltransferase
MADDKEREQRIRERAYQIWLEEGKPEGGAQQHWERALEAIEKEQKEEKKEEQDRNSSGRKPARSAKV